MKLEFLLFLDNLKLEILMILENILIFFFENNHSTKISRHKRDIINYSLAGDHKYFNTRPQCQKSRLTKRHGTDSCRLFGKKNHVKNIVDVLHLCSR